MLNTYVNTGSDAKAKIENRPENPLYQRNHEWCLRQVSKSNFDVVWPWPVTSWPKGRPFYPLAPWTTCANLHQDRFICLWNIVFTSLTYFGFLWHWPLTSWLPKVNVSSPCPVDFFAAELVHSFLKYHVHKTGNGRTNRRTDVQTGWEHYVSSQSAEE